MGEGLTYDMELRQDSISMLRLAESQLKQQGKLTKPIDYGGHPPARPRRPRLAEAGDAVTIEEVSEPAPCPPCA